MRRTQYFVLFAVLSSGAAWAHTGVGPTAGLALGIAHPFSGLDHVLAMVLVGMLAVQIGGRAIWALPMSFVAMMVVGGVAGMAGVAVPLVEVGIALSVLALGGVLAFGWKPPVALAIAAAGIFAVFHGHSHGTEMRHGLSALGYASGFVLATLTLHGAGLLLGLGLKHMKAGALALRLAGGSAAAIGVLMLIGAA